MCSANRSDWISLSCCAQCRFCCGKSQNSLLTSLGFRALVGTVGQNIEFPGLEAKMAFPQAQNCQSPELQRPKNSTKSDRTQLPGKWAGETQLPGAPGAGKKSMVKKAKYSILVID